MRKGVRRRAEDARKICVRIGGKVQAVNTAYCGGIYDDGRTLLPVTVDI